MIHFTSTLSNPDPLALDRERAYFICEHGVPELRKLGGLEGLPLWHLVTIAEQPQDVQYSMLAAGIKVPPQEPEPASEPVAGIKLDVVIDRIDTTTDEEDERILAKIAAKRAAKKSGALFPEVAAEIELTEKRMEPTDDEFQSFWDAYPRHVDKKKAKTAFAKAFKSLRKTLSPAQAIKTIMDGVIVYAEHVDKDAICHPTTWLNGARWEDERESISNKPSLSRSRGSDYGEFHERTPEELAVF